MDQEYQKYLSKAQTICARQEKCRYDIMQKLIQWGLDKERAGQVVSSLVKENFIDELRYTKFYVRDKLRLNKWGKVKIRYMLTQKKINQETIDREFSEINEKEYRSILNELLKNKYQDLEKKEDPQIKAKLFRFGESRGFEFDLIYKEIGNIFKGQL